MKHVQIDGSMRPESDLTPKTWAIEGWADNGNPVTFTVEATTEDKALREAAKRAILNDPTATVQ